jgi:uncharacterized metal-binding protein
LKKLGINKQEPEELTEEEIKKFVRLNIDPTTLRGIFTLSNCLKYDQK